MQATQSAVARPTRIRHVVLWFTVAAYMITYMDRTVIATATPLIQKEFGFSDVMMGWILFSFRWGYSLFQIPGGWLGDLLGPRRALALIVTWWSVFTSMTAAAWSLVSMAVFRFLFGMGEAGAFPIATRSLSRWMLPSERGYAQGITHAGSRLGAAVTPYLVVWLITIGGWRMPFLVFGAVGLIWSAAWYIYYRDSPQQHSSVNPAELELIQQSLHGPRSSSSRNVPWKRLFGNHMVWTLSAMYFCYGYCLAVYLDWFPKYLNGHRGFTLKQMGFYASLPLVAGVAGDFLGGWVSDHLLKSGTPLRSARRLAGSIGFAVACLMILPATITPNPYACVAYSCAAVFGLELTVGVSWAIPWDIGGDFAGSTSSIMNMCGNIGGAISTLLLGYLVESYGWNVPFLVASGWCAAGALLFWKIDASRRIFTDGPQS